MSNRSTGSGPYGPAPRHMAPSGSRHRAGGPRRRRVLVPALALCVAVLVLAVAGGVYAWYTHQVSRANTFQTADLAPTVEEVFDGTTKSNVTVKANDASVPVYIRVQVTIGWVAQDSTAGESEAIFAVPTAGADYTMTWGSAVYERDAVTADQLAKGCWVKAGDGFYYWSKPVAAGGSTGQLIDSCTWADVSGATDGRKLSVDIAAQAIQADTDPANAAFDDAWRASSGLAVGTSGTLEVAS